VNALDAQPATSSPSGPTGWSPLEGGPRGWRLQLRASLSGAARAAIARVVYGERFEELEPIADGRRSLVRRLEAGGVRYVVKRYDHPRGFLLRTFLRRSRAEREARGLCLLEEALPDTPTRAVAWAERRRGGLCRHGVVVTTELTDSHDLRPVKHWPAAERSRVAAAVVDALPPRVAAIHDHGVFVRTLRGKNVLLQPATGRLALIDLPYAERVGRLRPSQRRYDLACLSLELRRFLTEPQWGAFLRRYRACARRLGPGEAERLTAAALAPLAARIDHRTGVSYAVRRLKKRAKRTGLGQWIMGHDYGQDERGAR